VPWPKHREVLASHRRLEAELARERERISKEYEPLGGKLKTLETQIAEMSRTKEEFDTLMWALDRHPELRDQLYRALGTEAPPPGTRQPTGGRATAVPPTPNIAQLPPELLSKIEENNRAIAEMRTQTRAAQLDAEQAHFDKQVEDTTGRFMGERGFDLTLELYPGYTLKDDVMDFLTTMGARIGGGTMDDVVPLLNRYYARQEAMRQFWLKGYTPGKVSDANLPAALPGGAPPLEIADKPLAISDPRINRQVADALRASLGGGA
jgi:hypothetical protein